MSKFIEERRLDQLLYKPPSPPPPDWFDVARRHNFCIFYNNWSCIVFIMKIFFRKDVHSNEIKESLSHLLFIPKSMNSVNLTAGNCTRIIFVNLWLSMNVSIVHLIAGTILSMVSNLINKTIVSFFSMSSPEKNPEVCCRMDRYKHINKTLVHIIFLSSLIFEK